MEKLRIQPNNYESGTSRSNSPFETINVKPQKNRQKSSYSWCVPRKTKTVSSKGDIFPCLTSATNMKKKKSRNRTKAQKIREKIFQSQKRINELSRPRTFLKSSTNSQQNIKVNLKKVIGSPKLPKHINELSKPKRVTFESYNFSQRIIGASLTSNCSLTLSNFEINKSSSNSKSISRQEWMDRINKLAEPRIRNPTPTNTIGKVAEKALNATASKRIKELATKKPLKLESSQKKDHDPYKVSPQALKAICSTRTKFLATPKIFNLHSHICNSVKENF